jgi:hypothetical protein
MGSAGPVNEAGFQNHGMQRVRTICQINGIRPRFPPLVRVLPAILPDPEFVYILHGFLRDASKFWAGRRKLGPVRIAGRYSAHPKDTSNAPGCICTTTKPKQKNSITRLIVLENKLITVDDVSSDSDTEGQTKERPQFVDHGQLYDSSFAYGA